MVSLPTCPIVLLVASVTISSNLNPLFTQSLKKFSIPAFPSLPRTLFKITIKSPTLNAAYPHLNIRFLFRPPTRISSFFPFKDKIPKLMTSGVAYLYKCRYCSASYVGQLTKHHLYTRLSENLGISSLTAKASSSPVMSSIFSHFASFDI